MKSEILVLFKRVSNGNFTFERDVFDILLSYDVPTAHCPLTGDTHIQIYSKFVCVELKHTDSVLACMCISSVSGHETVYVHNINDSFIDSKIEMVQPVRVRRLLGVQP